MSKQMSDRKTSALAIGTTIALGAALLAGGTPASAAEDTAAVYKVTQEGLTAAEGESLASAYKVGNALEANGSFSYVDSTFGQVPLVTGEQGRDESGRPTVSQALDFKALDRIKPIADAEAIERASALVKLSALSPELTAKPSVSHTELTLSDNKDKVTGVRQLDTAVSFGLTLGGLPVTGQGARLRITFAPDGAVSQLAHALRKVERSDTAKIINPATAAKSCAALYPAGTRQLEPTLGYQFPALSAQEASGRGTVSTIYPQYTCNPVAESGTLAHRLVPAVPDSAPAGNLGADRSGDKVNAEVSVSGGTEPYTYRWSSSSTTLPTDRNESSISYVRSPRDSKDANTETVTVEVTDANGLAATASVELEEDGSGSAETVPGGGGFGELAIGPIDVGIEQTVDEWQCAQDSAIGFRNVMAAHGVGIAFDWRGYGAWESDFKSASLGGGDASYVDNVDAAWYTGHGWPGGFTFKGNHTDTSIVPGDAKWGDRDLEWMQLESCQVLADTSGTWDYFSRWGPVFNGLHILNGFHTNAYCISGGTGGTFADYLFPKNLLYWVRPALRVQSAWANMAITREPHGVVYRSMGLFGPNGVNNIGDFFWNQGATGPDIAPSPLYGKWSISGTV
jgi:hypothetical protein